MIGKGEEKREVAKIRQLVDEYAKLGYSPVPADEIPLSIRSLKPDLVVSDGSSFIVCEIKSKANIQERSLQSLAQEIESLSSWKLELIYLGEAVSELPGVMRIQDSVARAVVVGEIDPTAGLLLGWAAAESALDLLISKADENFSDQLDRARSPRKKVEALESLGLISSTQAEVLYQAADVRNKAAHSIIDVSFEDLRSILQELLDVVRLISREGYASVDTMVEWFGSEFIDPIELLPYDSSEGGYQFYAGGPDEPLEILENEFPEASSADRVEAARILEDESTLWVRRRDYEPDES